MKKEYAEEVAAKVIEQLEQGTAPWQRGWQPGEIQLPRNASTGAEYKGFNTMWLAMQGRSDPRWMTYKQAAEAGAQVQGGEKGTKIVYWKFSEERKELDGSGNPVLGEDGKPKTVNVQLERPRSFHAVVFNAEQISGLPPLESKQIGPEKERHDRAEAVLSNSGAKINLISGATIPHYSPLKDAITMPVSGQFDSAEQYYATALHELAHWTGHPSRMDRDLAHPFGSEGYAREELRAEIASLMLGEQLELGHDPGNHAAYVGSWIKALKDDPYEIFRAAAEAQKITSYVMEFEHEKALEKESASQMKPEPEMSKIQHYPPENVMAGRTYLAVPYSEKDQAKDAAKAAGFQLHWDKEAKSWYAPPDVDLSGLAQWKGDGARVLQNTTDSAETQFSRALSAAGLRIDGPPIMDGKIHRVAVDGDRGTEKSGAYAGHTEGRMPGGYIQNYKTGERINWKAEGPVEQIAPEERARLAAEAAQRQEQRTAITQAKQLATAEVAVALWEGAPAATADHPYCQKKGICEAGLRIVPEPDAVPPAAAAMGIKIVKTSQEAKVAREADPDARVFKTGDLLIPGRDTDGKLWTLQSVNPDFKSFMKGGRKHGLFAVAGAEAEGGDISTLFRPEQPLIVAEGYATAATVAKMAGQPVIVAFDAGNLDAVAGKLRDYFPDRPMVIAADNDHIEKFAPNGKPQPNVGLTKAHEAAEKHGAGVAVPSFLSTEKGSDWNDLSVLLGEEAAQKAFTDQLAIAKRDAAIAAERMTTLARERDGETRDDPSTSADDAFVSAERGKAAETIVAASEQRSAVNNAAAEAKLANGTGQPATASAMASLDQKTSKMQEAVKQERQDAQDNSEAQSDNDNAQAKPPQQRARRRSRGQDAGM